MPGEFYRHRMFRSPLFIPRSTAGWLSFAVTSGKGSVGKTFVPANLASVLAKRGHKVLVLDANLDVMLNLYPKITLHDMFNGKARLEEAILQAPGGFSVLPAGPVWSSIHG